jgi:phosphoribosylformylglycinamidine synthase subunit PurS
MKYKARIFVTLRPSVLDPAGTAVKSALEQMHHAIESVRIGKYIEIVFNAENHDAATEQVNLACDRLLANPVIENYTFELNPSEP